MQLSFYEQLILSLRERQNFYQDKILTGNLSFDEYKSMTGKLVGLQESEEVVMNTYKSLFENVIKE